MKEILELIDNRKQRFSKLPFFEFLRDHTINPRQRLSFAPCAAPFIMSFGELNKDVFREEPTTNEIQAIINKHTYEDDSHWLWFLEDIKKLGLNHSFKFDETLKFLWSEETKTPRWLTHELYRHTYKADPWKKLVVIEAIEATGSIFLSEVTGVAKELQKMTGEEYRYFGNHHHAIDSNHSIVSNDTENSIENIDLKKEHRVEAKNVVDEIFAIFEEFTHALLKYSQRNNINEKVCSGFPNNNFEYLIIGAGPAGLQSGYYLEKAKRSYLILEAGDAPGSFFSHFPRHRKLISINKQHTGYEDPEINLRWDWNSLLSEKEELLFKHYSKSYFPHADDFVKYLGDFANSFNLHIKYGVQVVRIAKDEKFMVIDARGNVYSCKHLIIATGCSKPYIPQIPGIEFAENYVDVSINPEDFVNQKVLIIGKGNSAFETADNLVETASHIHISSPNPISFAWRTKYVGHLRAVNNNFLDTYQLKSQNAVLDATINKIVQKDNQFVVTVTYTHAHGEQEDLTYDRVIVCTGFRFNDSIFDQSCRPELSINNRFPDQTSEWESKNVKDLYFAGILMHTRDFKKKQSGFIHGFRYNIRVLHQILDQKYHSKPIPNETVSLTPKALSNAILKRVNRSSCLWQQSGFLCDLIVVSKKFEEAQYYQALPKDYIHDSKLGHNEHYYTISLDFGDDVDKVSDPFKINRVHKADTNNASQSEFIHPIIRCFSGPTLVAEHHIIEDLANEWLEDEHVHPLLRFLDEQLARKSKRIGDYLVEAGLVTLNQVEIALLEQKKKKNSIRLGEIISSHGWVNQQTIECLLEGVLI